MRRLLAALAIAGVLAAGTTATASAALWGVLTVSPPSPTAGVPAEVHVRTFATFDADLIGDLATPEAALPAPSGLGLVLVGTAYPYEVRAVGPDGREVEIVVAPDPDDPSLYRGPATFREPGLWTIWLPQFNQPRGPRDLPGVRLEVEVASPAVTRAEPGLPVLVGLALAGLGAFFAIRLRRAAD